MAETDLHKRLVRSLASLVRQRRSGSWFLFVDAIDERCEGCPPIVGSSCPDLYARENPNNYLIIGEAKTARDLDNPHTEQQLGEYFTHLTAQASGELIVAVPLLCAGAAHRLCRVAKAKFNAENVPFEITGWMFGPKPTCGVWRG
jgi:hypothetical protein